MICAGCRHENRDQARFCDACGAALPVACRTTTSVGIRDLKNHAPQLVRRAALGERIVITRYGKPHAVLGPAVDAHEPGHRVRMQAWQRERGAFERLGRTTQRSGVVESSESSR